MTVKQLPYPIYYINLKRARNRNRHMIKQLRRYNAEYYRVNAVDGKRLNDYNITTSDKMNKFHPNEIACTLSHIKAYKMALKHNHNVIMVMEDDIDLSLIPHWTPPYIKDIVKNAPNNWGIIQLHIQNPKHIWGNYFGDDDHTNDNPYVAFNNEFYSTVCYIINKPTMQVFANINKRLDFDEFRADYFLYQGVTTYTYYKPLFLLKDYTSQIAPKQKARRELVKRSNRVTLKYIYKIKL
uniref:Glycosyltransferase family 25 n=1 Tax=Megaviridae environmental sample TaxID=1737588 RepID=A0A5J6VJV7_9VIRU|nr:MAG: glycosyltransferase family 25 [Megaviridae environmental sample]